MSPALSRMRLAIRPRRLPAAPLCSCARGVGRQRCATAAGGRRGGGSQRGRGQNGQMQCGYERDRGFNVLVSFTMLGLVYWDKWYEVRRLSNELESLKAGKKNEEIAPTQKEMSEKNVNPLSAWWFWPIWD